MIRLAYQSFGDAAPPLLVVHGLFGSSVNWRAIARALSDRYRVLVPDLRNHGRSPWQHGMDYFLLAEDLAAFIDRRDLGSPIVLGHSMGGKAAMVLALTDPARVKSLIAVDIAPVGYAHSHLPFIEAMQRIDPGGIRSRKEAGERLREAIPDARIRGFLLQNLERRDHGFRWRINLEALARNMEALTGFPDLRPRRWDGPALFIHGALSDYLRPEHRESVLAYFPNARFEEISDAGHWLHAERPGAFLEAVTRFLEEEGSA